MITFCMKTLKKYIKKIMGDSFVSYTHGVLAYMGAIYYNFPSKKMVIIGVTGTKGKTTTSQCIWSVLNAGGYKAGYITTASIRIGEKEIAEPREQREAPRHAHHHGILQGQPQHRHHKGHCDQELSHKGGNGRFPDLRHIPVILRLLRNMNAQRIGEGIGNRNGHNAADHDGS